MADLGNTLNRSLELLLTLEGVNLRELFEVRRILEGEAAALAVERHSHEDLARMAGAIAQMERGLGDRDAYAAADVHFHLTVAAATGNRIAVQMMLAIRDVLQRALVQSSTSRAARTLARQHRPIIAAIAAADADEARGRMIKHLTRVEARSARRPRGRLRPSHASPRRRGAAQWRASATWDSA